MIKPRLLKLKSAKSYLAGLDPRDIGINPITTNPLRFDKIAIDYVIEQWNLELFATQNHSNPNQPIDTEQELMELERKILALPERGSN